VLGASNDTSILNTANGLSNGVAREVWIGGETFPVTLAVSVLSLIYGSSFTYTTLGVAANRTNNRSKLNVNTLATML
jgi:hypothetical protein